MQKTVYQKMLGERFYLYRPWTLICKSIEAKVIGDLELASPILDIGCGDGLFATYCFKKRIDEGLDYDPRATECARKRDIYKRVRHADACSLPFKDNIFQTIVSICAIEHIPDLNKVLSNVYRVLKKGGKFIFTVPSQEFKDFLFTSRFLRLLGLVGFAQRYGERKNRRSGHMHIYTPARWKEVLEESGFNIESIAYIFPKEAVFLWSFLHSLPFKFIFLPFRPFKDLNVKIIDGFLKASLDGLLSGWIEKRSRIYSSDGGYLLIQAKK